MVRKIDAISIGIGADLSQFKQQLAQAAKIVNETAIPNKVVKVTVRAEIDRKAIEYATSVVVSDLNAVAKRQITFKPKLTATKANVQEYVKAVNELFVAAANDPTNKINKGLILKPTVQLQISPDEIAKLKDAVQAGMKSIAVGLTWYWQNGPPPSGAQGGTPAGPGPSGGGRGPGTGPRPRYNPGPAGGGGPGPSGGRRGPTTGGGFGVPTGAPATGGASQGFTAGGGISPQQAIVNAAYGTAGSLADAESVVAPMGRTSNARAAARFERSAAAQQAQAYERETGFIGPRRPVAGTGVTPNTVKVRKPSPFTLTPSERRRIEAARQLRNVKFKTSDVARDFRASNFGRLSPRLGEAFDAMQAGEDDLARDLLRHQVEALAGADPKQRKKFFDALNDPTNVPGHLLAADAAIRGMIFDIGVRTDPDFVIRRRAAEGLAGTRGEANQAKPSTAALATPTKEHPFGQRELKGQDVRFQRARTSSIIEGAVASMRDLTPAQRRERAHQIAAHPEVHLHPDTVMARFRALGIKFRAKGGPVGKPGQERWIANQNNWMAEYKKEQEKKNLERAHGVPGVSVPHDPERYSKANRLISKSYARVGRRMQAEQNRMISGLDPTSPERLAGSKLVDEAEALDAKIRGIHSRAWQGKAKGGPVGRVARDFAGPPLFEDLREMATKKELAEILSQGEVFNPKLRAIIQDQTFERKMLWHVPGMPRKMAGGGKSGKQPYVVGEKGSELFVPESAGWIIPHHLMDQLPKRADGGPAGGRPKGDDLLDLLMQNPAFRSSAETMGEPRSAEFRQQREFQRLLKNALLGIKVGEPGYKQAAPLLKPAISAPLTIEASEPITISNDKAFEGLPESFKAALAREGITPEAFGSMGGDGGNRRPPTAREQMEEGPDPKLTPAQKVGIQIRRELARQQPIERATGIRAEISEQVALSPIRALSVSIGQIFSTITGRADIIKRGREANALVEMGTHLANIRLATDADIEAREELINQKKAQHLEITEDEVKTVEDLKVKSDLANRAATGFFDEAEERTRKILPLRAFVGNLVASTAGIVTGTIGFSLALGAAQTAIELAGKALDPVVDRMSGFAFTTTKVTAALTESTAAQSGNARVAVATAAAQSAMTEVLSAQISPALQLRAAGETSNKNLQTQIDLMRTSQRVGGQQIAGADLSAFKPTGGVGGTEFLAIPSTLQLITEQLRRVRETQPPGEPTNPLALPDWQSGLKEALGFGDKGPLILDFPATGPRLGYPSPQRSPEQNAQARDIFDVFNQSIRKGGGAAQFVPGLGAGRPAPGVKAADVEKTATAALSLGRAFPALEGEMKALAEAVRSTSTAILKDGEAITQEGLYEAVIQAQRGANRPTAASILNLNAERRQAQIGVIQEQARRQRDQFLPAQRYLQFQQNQPLPVGAGIVPPPGAQGFGGFSAQLPAMSQDFKSFQATAGTALDYVRQRAMAGRKELLGMGVPVNLLNQLDDFSNRALQIQTTMANKAAVVTATQYNHQLFIARRNLADARALSGQIAGNEEGRLGALQRQNVLLDRQSQQLSLQAATLSQMLQQRQINFSVAIAGFQAPGLTSEEREARIQQAKLEAKFAQQQLDIAKQQTSIQRKQVGVGIKIFDESNLRAINDAKFAIADLQAGFALQMDNAQAMQALDAIHQGEAQLMEDINSYFGEYQQLLGAALGEVPEIVAASGEAFSKVLHQTARAWNIFTIQAISAGNQIIAGISAPGTRTPTGERQQLHTGDRRQAPGFFGSFASATTMTVGEAGSETVAILRNARNMTVQPTMGSGGGSGVNINIMVTGNSVRDEGDLDALVSKITNRVERLFQRRGSLLGMRNLTG